jgi:hypothetical protein
VEKVMVVVIGCFEVVVVMLIGCDQQIKTMLHKMHDYGWMGVLSVYCGHAHVCHVFEYLQRRPP